MIERLLTPGEVKEVTRAGSITTIYKWARKGQLRSCRAGRLLRFREQDVLDFLNGGQENEQTERTSTTDERAVSMV
ncbi:MAG: helix-turn-helix domain-containing protein [Acidobacteria bacterium]|nr:helix-turn-helix domain-containing protein [Acidobacteriota bacterium]MCZ6752244.1 helix-turn-helix domain-containing protein [Acidobacteriota bacterium]